LRRGRHNLYTYIVDYPPKGVEYIVPPKPTISKSSRFDSLKRFAYLHAHTLFKEPLKIPITTDAELVHSAGGMIPVTNKPWILGYVEHIGDFVGFTKGWLARARDPVYHRKIEKALSGEQCKGIITYADAGKRTLERTLDISRFEEKLSTINIAVPLNAPAKRQETGMTRFFFMGSMNFPHNFEIKGGREVIHAFKRMHETNPDTELIIRSAIPDYLKKEVEHDAIRVISAPLSWSKLSELFMQTHVFVQPNYLSAATAPIEAMSFGLPLITARVGSNPEIVAHKKNGLLFDAPTLPYYDDDLIPRYEHMLDYAADIRNHSFDEETAQIEACMILMAERPQKRKAMAQDAHASVEHGKFSIGVRNKTLKALYNAALDV